MPIKFKFLLVIAFLTCHHIAFADVNLAIGKPVTASSYYSDGSEVFPPGKVVDGITIDSGSPNNWSFWLSAQGTSVGQWIQVDLGQNVRLNKIVLFDTHNRHHYDRGTKNFRLEISSDNQFFQVIGYGHFTESQWRNQTPVEVILTNKVIGRYLRFNVDSCWGCQSSGLAEIQAYGQEVIANKACSIFISGKWRDTVNVPQTWTAATCNNYRSTIRATSYNLACIFNNTYSFGANNGGLPSPNCGW